MRIELAQQRNMEMWFFDKNTCAIWPLWTVAESESGKMVELGCGKRYLTGCKNHAIFYSYEFAMIAMKTEKKEFDEEYYDLLKKNKLKRFQPHKQREASGQ